MIPEITPIRLDTPKEQLLADGTRCAVCHAGYKEADTKCGRCGFPISGSEQEKSDFDLQYKTQRAAYEGSLQEASKGTKALYWLAGLVFVGNFVLYAVSDVKEISYPIVGALIAILFIILAQWSKKKPYEALLSALIIYIVLMVADGIAEPSTLVKGFLVKFIIIGFLGRGVKAANEARKKWAELESRHWDQPILD